MIADEIFISLTRLMNHNQISVSRYETDHIRITYEVTFSKLHTDGDIIEVVVMDKMNEYGIEDHVFGSGLFSRVMLTQDGRIFRYQMSHLDVDSVNLFTEVLTTAP